MTNIHVAREINPLADHDYALRLKDLMASTVGGLAAGSPSAPIKWGTSRILAKEDEHLLGGFEKWAALRELSQGSPKQLRGIFWVYRSTCMALVEATLWVAGAGALVFGVNGLMVCTSVEIDLDVAGEAIFGNQASRTFTSVELLTEQDMEDFSEIKILGDARLSENGQVTLPRCPKLGDLKGAALRGDSQYSEPVWRSIAAHYEQTYTVTPGDFGAMNVAARS
jgi:hypothetical protein